MHASFEDRQWNVHIIEFIKIVIKLDQSDRAIIGCFPFGDKSDTIILFFLLFIESQERTTFVSLNKSINWHRSA